MPILFPVNCDRTNLFSVKRDLLPSLPPSSQQRIKSRAGNQQKMASVRTVAFFLNGFTSIADHGPCRRSVS